jgi:hypothetical protein
MFSIQVISEIRKADGWLEESIVLVEAVVQCTIEVIRGLPESSSEESVVSWSIQLYSYRSKSDGL